MGDYTDIEDRDKRLDNFFRRMKLAIKNGRGMRLTPEEVRVLGFYLTTPLNGDGTL